MSPHDTTAAMGPAGAPVDPWSIPPPVYPTTHLPGAMLGLAFDPRREIPLREMRLMHAVVTNLLDTKHSSTAPLWSLLYVGNLTTSGWAIYLHNAEHVAQLAHHTFPVTISGRDARTALLTFSAPTRLRSPVAKAGPTAVELESVTPVSVQKSAMGGKSSYARPTTRSMHSALLSVARRLGIHIAPADVVLRILRREVTSTGINMGGKLNAHGVVYGWTGKVAVELNPAGRWLADVAALIGIGGKTAMGFGRVRMREMVVQRPGPPPLPTDLSMAGVADQAIVSYRERIDPNASVVRAIDVIADMLDRAEFVGMVEGGPEPVEMWIDPTTRIRLLAHRLSDLVLSVLLPPGVDPTQADLAPPRAVDPLAKNRGKGPTARSSSPAARVAPASAAMPVAAPPLGGWEVSDLAVTTYRLRVERVTEERARARLRWHMARAGGDGNGWWTGPAPASLRMLVSDGAIVALDVKVVSDG